MKTPVRMSLLAMVLGLWSSAGQAEEGDQFYFTGYTAPRGSVSQSGAATDAVYLRWDVVEGALPGDVVRIRLLRNDVEIFDVAADAVLDAVSIDVLYAGAHNSRRKIEIIGGLDGAKEDGAPAVTSFNYADVLQNRLVAAAGGDASARMWAVLASRMDINVAIARYRGYVDTDLTGGVVKYTLVGISDLEAEAVLGEVFVDHTQRFMPEAATAFEQVRQFGRCDAPEYARSHGVVALSWDHPGANDAERYANAVNIAGYDLYRTAGPVPPPPALPPFRDLRAEAAVLPHGPDGEVQFPGLERVTDDLVTIGGRPDVDSGGRRTEGRNRGWNPDFAQFMLPKKDVEAMGLVAGDVRAFYVVPRDLSGNYGDTAPLTVVIPDSLAPPSPWAVEAIAHSSDDDTDDELRLQWDHVSVANYHRTHRRHRTYCNLDEAVLTQRLEYAPLGSVCGAGGERTINLNVAKYLVYRFRSQSEAATFVDSDGDGVSDAEERVLIGTHGGLPLTAPDLACDPTQQPFGAHNYLVGAIDAVPANISVTANGRNVIRFADPVPASQKGDVYWYRVKAVGLNGTISEISAPVRGFFPDETKPMRPDGDEVPFYECTDYARQAPEPIPGLHATDETGRAAEVRFICNPRDENPAGEVRDPEFAVRNPFLPGTGISVVQNIILDTIRSVLYILKLRPVTEDLLGGRIPDKECQTLQRAAERCELIAQFIDKRGRILAQTPVDMQGDLCGFTVELVRDCREGRRPIEPGTVINPPVVLDLSPIDECVHIYIEIDGESLRLETICPGDWPWQFDPPNLGGGEYCLSVAVTNENGQTSTDLELPCFKLEPTGPPVRPKLTSLDFDTPPTEGTLRWESPDQPTSGIIAEWYRDDGEFRRSEFLGHAGRYGVDNPHETQIELTAVPAAGDEELWCVRARSVAHSVSGGSGLVSDWTTPMCRLRLPPAEVLPEYIPWPKISVPNEMSFPLLVHYLPADQRPAVLIGAPDLDNDIGRQCRFVGAAAPCRDDIACVFDEPIGGLDCANFCQDIRESMGQHTRFVVYRQGRKKSTDVPKPFYQVSPLIDRAFCTQACPEDPDELDPNPPDKGGSLDAPGLSNGIKDSGERYQFPGINPKEREQCIPYLHDPFIKLLTFASPPSGWAQVALAFVDRFPFTGGWMYRYQFVYFDERGEITGHRTSDWFTAN